MPADKPKYQLCLHGHNWRAQPDELFSTVISAQGNKRGGVYNIELINGASDVHDYLYRSVHSGGC